VNLKTHAFHFPDQLQGRSLDTKAIYNLSLRI